MKIALIEIVGSHDECLYSQIKIMGSTSNIDLTLICDESLRENVKHFDSIDKCVFFSMEKGYKRWISLFRLWRLCRLENYDKIIFNTAHGRLLRIFLAFPFGRNTNFYGILHNIRKLNSSRSQKSISRKIKHYFILNDYLKKKITGNFSFSTFYPVFFPQYQYQHQSVDKKEDQIWICIPGQVELRRRDYRTLFQSIKEYGVNKNMKFLLLGRYGHKHGDGVYIKQQISSLEVQEHFLLWEKFIPDEIFHSMFRLSDYVLPLIHEGEASGNLYQDQITGAFNLAIGYQKPMIIEKNISKKLNLNEAITYEKRQLMKTLNELKPCNGDKFYQKKKFTFEFQKEKYLESIGITLPNKN